MSEIIEAPHRRTKCYACDRPLQRVRRGVYTEDGQLQFVGPDCYEHVIGTGEQGYQPPLGGPRLFGPNLLSKGPRS